MGRIGEVIRTWQVAHVMKARRGGRPATNRPTICAHAGTWRSTRSTRRSRTASTARSAPSNRASSPTSRYGSRSSSACARRSSSGRCDRLGRPRRSERLNPHTAAGVGPPDFRRRDRADLSLTFVSPAALDDGLAQRLGLRRRLVPLRPTRSIGKKDESQRRPADHRHRSRHLRHQHQRRSRHPAPAERLPLAQLYSMF